MRKVVILVFIITFVLIISGCSRVPKSVEYLEYKDKEFVKQSEGVYKSENDYVYYNVINGNTEITMTFSDVVIIYNPKGDAQIIQSDQCFLKYKTKGNASFLVDSSDEPNHNHVYENYLSLTFEQKDNTEAERIQKKNTSIITLVILLVAGIILSFPVFKPNIIRELKILKNSIFPMHEEPYEPTDLNVSISHVSVILLFIAIIVWIIIILNNLL